MAQDRITTTNAKEHGTHATLRDVWVAPVLTKLSLGESELGTLSIPDANNTAS